MKYQSVLNQITALRVMLDCLQKEVEQLAKEEQAETETVDKHATFGSN